jgi:hypothetical protein
MSVSAAIAASAQSQGISWTTFIGIPAAIVAALALLSYFVGLVRPLAIRKPRYWHEARGTKFSCVVVNRSLLFDRNIEAISFIVMPILRTRLRHPFWRRKPQLAQFAPWGEDIASLQGQPMKLTKRERRTLRGEIRKPGGSEEKVTLQAQVRIQAHSGDKRSRSRRVQFRRLT